MAVLCHQVVKNDKHFLDQSLDEIKLLLYLNNAGDCDEAHVLQMFDFFYYKEHLVIVTEVRVILCVLFIYCLASTATW